MLGPPLGSILTGPIICGCSSASTSFMLASLRVLHVDSSHAPAAARGATCDPAMGSNGLPTNARVTPDT